MTLKVDNKSEVKMRLRVRKEYAWRSGAFTPTNEVRYVYDGMLVIQERNANNIPLATYTRWLDLSSSRQGAGGIGGLLARTDNGLWNGSGTDGAHTYYSADGNGNVTCLLNSRQIVVGRYVYDPYGNTLSMSGPMATVNPYRFSSKEYMGNSGLYAYGYRFYEPSLQRWLNRDPLASGSMFSLNLPKRFANNPWERIEGPNIYLITRNNPVNWVDRSGLDFWQSQNYWGYNNPPNTQSAGKPNWPCNTSFSNAEVFPWFALARHWVVSAAALAVLNQRFQNGLAEAQKHTGNPTFVHFGFGFGAVTLTSSDGNTMSIPAVDFGSSGIGFIPGTIDESVVGFYYDNTMY